jgi:hypothetical protein
MCQFCTDSPDAATIAALTRLQAALATPNLRDAVNEYFDADSTFAGRTFDLLGSNPYDRITTDDLLAVTLLDRSWTPPAVRALVTDGANRFNELLYNVDSKAELWGDEACQALIDAESLWNLLIELPGVGSTTAGKLLARKRPLLVPIADSIIISAVGTSGRTWCTLRYCFKQPSFRKAVEGVRSYNAVDLSLLRIFDVAIWMLCSRSESVRNARGRVGMSNESCYCGD